MRTEHDFLGEMNVPDNVYYGVQTMRAMENFHITGEHLDPDFIQAMAIVKKAAALANMETGRLDKKIGNALVQAASEIIDGQWLDQFPVDPIQGGAGTSVNMNMNEVLCNRALEIMGKEKGRYDLISPNNHANMAQSTNDVFPTSIKVCLSMKGKKLTAALKELETELDVKADEFKDVIKMGRTHLQDAVPITLGQEMGAYASAVARGRKRISRSLEGVHVINMGGTAVGTDLNAEPAYIKAVAAGDRARLYSWCAANEGLDGRAAAAFVDSVQEQLGEMLCARRDCLGLSHRELRRLCALMDRCAACLRVNVGPKHIFGLLAVDSIAGSGNRG